MTALDYEKRARSLPADIFWLLLARREFSVALILLLTVLSVGIVNPAFLSLENLRDILVKAAPLAIIGCGLTFVILTGEIDISVGSLTGLLAAVLGLLVSPRHAALNVPVAILLILLLGAAVGLANGLLISYARVPSIIVTLGMLSALRGLTQLLMHGAWITDLPPAVRFFGTGMMLLIPVSIWTASLVIIVCSIIATRTPIGRRIYAVGSNPHAAVLAGLSPQRIKLLCFMLTGLLVAIATIVSAPQLGVIDVDIGTGWELFVVTAVVVGGASISGGRGSILGTLLGVILLSIIRSALIFLKLGTTATYWERAIQGLFILVAVLADHFTARRSRFGEEE